MNDEGAEFGVLGPLQICVDGAAVALGTPKQRAVLAMLLINRNRPVATATLIDAAWEQFPPPDPRASLHSYVSNLRKLLGGIGLDPRTALVSAPPGYRLNVPESACDIGRFASEKNAGVQAAAAGRFEQASRNLSAALAEWRGSGSTTAPGRHLDQRRSAVGRRAETQPRRPAQSLVDRDEILAACRALCFTSYRAMQRRD